MPDLMPVAMDNLVPKMESYLGGEPLNGKLQSLNLGPGVRPDTGPLFLNWICLACRGALASEPETRYNGTCSICRLELSNNTMPVLPPERERRGINYSQRIRQLATPTGRPGPSR